MDRRTLKRLDEELREYLDSMVEGMGRPERRAAMAAYVTGLLLDGERKSIQPMAARLVDNASETEAMRQRLQECVVISGWSDAEVFRRLGQKLERELPGLEAFVLDDTGFPKKGTHSAGVARQYSGTLGRIDNCQVAVSLHLAGENGSGCIGMRMYLPEAWAKDTARRKKAGIPEDVGLTEKWRLALAQLDSALASGVRKHVVLADPGYGDCGDFRDGLVERGLDYVVGIKGETSVWPPGSTPTIRKKPPGSRGRPSTRHYDDKHPPVLVGVLAKELKYRAVSWREGSRGWQSSRFAAVRIRTAHRHMNGVPPGDEQWLLCQWPQGAQAPTKFWLSSLPADTSIRTLVRLAKLRWRIERDYQEMKQELGLDHFEGRTWRGFHHHATLCAMAHGFLALRRALSPPGPGEMDAA
ncbi:MULTISPECIES: IS701 family transposase [unclassified Corallococcus]|uniref:IS701 family transposase n=1 Tax=unclassified Corallococcus TaxID=2685029 RepID=UPI001F5D34F2|nr:MULTISPECIES: IS701 family transposase [unclassified Corallococcus]WAS85878.1 IS701 family transposase [Corallococcus sp. NCRR]